jgi:hypothetical protein
MIADLGRSFLDNIFSRYKSAVPIHIPETKTSWLKQLMILAFFNNKRMCSGFQNEERLHCQCSEEIPEGSSPYINSLIWCLGRGFPLGFTLARNCRSSSPKRASTCFPVHFTLPNSSLMTFSVPHTEKKAELILPNFDTG